ncbi:hypothetical protein HK101_008191 [Irineochytrium annulatum]|nr:hypothetical protein HK101_008191 [Irineochytrium annulatum]
MEEIKLELKRQEVAFLGIVKDIQDINAGKWDAKFWEAIQKEGLAAHGNASKEAIESGESASKEESAKFGDEMDAEPTGKAEEEEVIMTEAQPAKEQAPKTAQSAEDETAGSNEDEAPDEASTADGETSGPNDEAICPSILNIADGSGIAVKRKPPKTNDKRRIFKRTCNMVWSTFKEHRYGNVFMKTLKEEKAPRYTELIKKPMNLSTIKNRIRDEEITTVKEFHRDVLLMFANAIMYNREDSDMYEMAQAMKGDCETELAAMQNARRLGSDPSR